MLGLGDRHPSNIMLNRCVGWLLTRRGLIALPQFLFLLNRGRYTGTLVHIDFGDCFEVAQEREHFPEKVPFRLTRMLTHALEAAGIEVSVGCVMAVYTSSPDFWDLNCAG